MVADRRVDFGYEYCWIICPSCRDRTRLTFEQYVTGERVRCVHCGDTVTTEDEHDLAVSAPDDVALDPSALSGVAWYHTSTYREWPPMNDEPTDSAIHLGTYEAAIENMLRRMRNESDADSQFHLHRVTLCVDPKDVTDVRGEASNWVGLTAQSVVRANGHRVLRYINRHEHKGSISLAVVPAVIATVQTVAIPFATCDRPCAAAAQAAIAYASECAAIEAARPDTSGIGRLERRFPKTAKDPKVAAIAHAAKACDDASSQAFAQFSKALEDSYLAGIAAPVRTMFVGALQSKKFDSATDWNETFCRVAELLTAPDRVIAALSTAPTRVLTGD